MENKEKIDVIICNRHGILEAVFAPDNVNVIMCGFNHFGKKEKYPTKIETVKTIDIQMIDEAIVTAITAFSNNGGTIRLTRDQWEYIQFCLIYASCKTIESYLGTDGSYPPLGSSELSIDFYNYYEYIEVLNIIEEKHILE